MGACLSPDCRCSADTWRSSRRWSDPCATTRFIPMVFACGCQEHLASRLRPRRERADARHHRRRGLAGKHRRRCRREHWRHRRLRGDARGPSGRVVAVEPAEDNLRRAPRERAAQMRSIGSRHPDGCRSAAAKPGSSICAATSAPSTACFRRAVMRWCRPSLASTWRRSTNSSSGRVDLVKIDVEGAELECPRRYAAVARAAGVEPRDRVAPGAAARRRVRARRVAAVLLDAGFRVDAVGHLGATALRDATSRDPSPNGCCVRAAPLNSLRARVNRLRIVSTYRSGLALTSSSPPGSSSRNCSANRQ